MKKQGPLSSPEEAREWLFGLLLRRSFTRREAGQRLRGRGLDGEAAERLLDEAQEMGLLDDAAYARLFAEGHESWGRDRIAFELGRRGVSDEDIQEALGDVDEQERLAPLIAAWRKNGLEDRKIVARLCRRGFDSRSIRAALRALEEDVPW